MSDGADFSLMDLFQEEVRTHAATLNQGLLELEKEPANPHKIEPLMRAAHSIKGAARIVNIEPAVQLAHVMEDAFVAAQEGRIRIGPADVDELLRGTDVLAGLSKVNEADVASWSAAHAAQIADLRERFRAIAQGQSAATHATAPPQQPQPPESPPASPAPSLPVPTSVAPPPAVPPAATEAAATPPADTETPTPPPSASAEAVVRVPAQSLNRLLGLAGESLVQARWLDPFSTALLKLKKQQDHLAAVLDSLAAQLTQQAGNSAQTTDHWHRTGQLVAEARRQSARCREVLAERGREFQEHAAEAEDLNSRLYREVIAGRRRRFADGSHGFTRLVRDMARTLDRLVRLEIEGQDTEVDRDILEKLEAPLTHLLRNAVDHGIEPPERRRSAGKPDT